MKYHKIENRKFFLHIDKPSTKMMFNNPYKNKYNPNINYLNTKNHLNKIKKNYTPIKTYNYPNNKKNEIIKTTPIKYQYRKIPFEKLKGFKFKIPNNNNNNILNFKQFKKKTEVNYPIICDHNNSTIQSNMNNYNNNTIKDTINYQEDININNINKEIYFYNKIKKPLNHQIFETKSSSLGSKYETREESAHFLKSKSSIKKEKEKEKKIIKNFSFIKFNKKDDKINLSPNKKLLKYINKAINQLNKIKNIIINVNNTKEENLSYNKLKENSENKYNKIDLSKIGKNLRKYKNIIDIDRNKINLSFERKNQTLEVNNNNYILNKKNKKTTFKKLNRTITYDDLRNNYKQGYKKFNINKINKINYMNKYNTINTEDKYKIKNSDTEIKIPKIDINYIKKMKNKKELNLINEEEKDINNKLKDRYKTENDGESNYYNDNKENATITDIANFEFSD